MANNPETKSETTKIYPPWFILSYDATKELYQGDDFRKQVISTLRTRKVLEMHEPVQTTIYFKEPNISQAVPVLCSVWKKLFSDYGEDFKFFIAPLRFYTKNGNPVREMVIDEQLNSHFHELLAEVLEAENKKKV